jgi:hypothetical protein
MKTMKDLEVEYTIHMDDNTTRIFKGNVWTFQETFRLIFGPGSRATHMIAKWNDIEEKIIDYVNWQNPTCCGTCKQQAENAKNVMEENSSFHNHKH